MRAAAPFDPLGHPLSGRHLIESSAGTGKTWTIASLYLRLLLEKRLSVGEVLVVTFTTAATEELRERIRGRIREALLALDRLRGGEGEEGGEAWRRRAAEEGGDPFLAGLLASLPEPALARESLLGALRTFDEAAIFTIHAFCQRVLKDNAFESASLFDTELATDDSELLLDLSSDFYRTEVLGGGRSPLLVRWLLRQGFFPEALSDLVRRDGSDPYLSVLPAPSGTRAEEDALVAAAERGYLAALEGARALWAKGRGEVARLLREAKGLNRTSYGDAIVGRMPAAMDALLGAPGDLSPPGKDEGKFLPSSLAAKTKKGHDPPAHPFLDAFGTLEERRAALALLYRERVAVRLRRDLLDFAAREGARRKRERNVRFYDDLLKDLHAALEGDGGRARRLRAAVRERYRAALIDEFQDTDLLQYRIFTSLFAPPSTLFLIGDPKQAIYGFRGADVFAYLAAVGEVDGRHSLGRNFRSSARLVAAVDTLFRRKPGSFVFPEIASPPVEADPATGARAFVRRGAAEPSPLRFWLLRRDPGASSISKEEARRAVAEAVASDVVSLLEEGRKGEALVPRDGGGGLEGIAPAHVAVLVGTNRHARLVREELRARGVPAVIHGSESVFSTREAEELSLLLEALADPARPGKVAAALATGIFGLDGGEIASLRDDEGAAAEWSLRFARYRERWEVSGFVAASRAILSEAGTRRRKLGGIDGERKLTNLLHLLELAHGAAHEEELGVEGLLRWLAGKRAEASRREAQRGIPPEEHQLRLETDEAAVKVVTVHRSKGLQYPVVYCPFLWDAWAVEEEPPGAEPFFRLEGAKCHEAGEDGRSRLVRDYGSPGAGARWAARLREELAEDARKLYVALTRARYRVTVAWGGVSEAKRSALAFLLHHVGPGDDPGVVAQARERFDALDDEGILADLRALAEDSRRDGTATVEVAPLPVASPARHVPAGPEEGVPACRSFRGEVPRPATVSSFSSLVAAAKDEEGRDRDEGEGWRRPSAAPPGGGGRAVRDFPRGVATGLFFHEAMELLDFSAGEGEVRRAVAEGLRKHRIGPEWEESAAAMVRDALATPLEEGEPGSALRFVSGRDRLAEVEFAFPLAGVTPAALADVFSSFGAGTPDGDRFASLLSRLSFSAARGVLRGFVDLVFRRRTGGAERYFLLDWKTNHLGAAPEDYGPEALRASVASDYYFLQYHLYAVALDRYLALRLGGRYDYGVHFGGVYYLYVRGLDPARGPALGVYRDRPPERLVRALSERLSGGAP